MKLVKRVLAVALVLMLVFSLSGCTAFEARMAKAANKMKKVDNFRMDIEMYLDMDMKLLGQTLSDMDMAVSGTMAIDKKHARAAGELHLEMPEEESDVLLYLEKDGDVVRTYSSNDHGETWTLKEQRSDPENPDDLFSVFDVGSITDLDREKLAQLDKVAKTFEEDGTVEVRGSESTLYRGTISLQDLDAEAALAALRESLNAGMGTELTEEDFAQIGDVPAVIGIDNRSGLISGFALDLTELMQGVVSIAMKTSLAQSLGGEAIAGFGIGVLGVTMEVNDCELEAVLYDYNEVGDIVIPAEVRENAVLVEEAA